MTDFDTKMKRLQFVVQFLEFPIISVKIRTYTFLMVCNVKFRPSPGSLYIYH